MRIVDPLPADDGWRKLAACRGMPVEWFFPSEQTKNGRPPAKHRQYKPICAVCPVREECLWTALPHEHNRSTTIGVWGGKSEVERWAWRKHEAGEKGYWNDRCTSCGAAIARRLETRTRRKNTPAGVRTRHPNCTPAPEEEEEA